MLCFARLIHVFSNMTDQPCPQFQKGSNYARENKCRPLFQDLLINNVHVWHCWVPAGFTIAEVISELPLWGKHQDRISSGAECEDPQRVRMEKSWMEWEPNHLLVKWVEDLWEVNLRSPFLWTALRCEYRLKMEFSERRGNWFFEDNGSIEYEQRVFQTPWMCVLSWDEIIN